MRIRRFVATTVAAATLAVGAGGVAQAHSWGGNSSPTPVSAADARAQFCSHASGFFTFFNQAMTDAIAKVEAALAAAQAAGGPQVADIAHRLDLAHRFQDAVMSFEHMILASCGTA